MSATIDVFSPASLARSSESDLHQSGYFLPVPDWRCNKNYWAKIGG
jgi:hypothetical protein